MLCFVPGGGAPQGGRSQIRPSQHGFARLHRGFRAPLRGLRPHGPRHGGGQEIPRPRELSCSSFFFLRDGSGSGRVGFAPPAT